MATTHIVSLAAQQLANPRATKRAKSLAAGILANAPRKAGAAVPKREARERAPPDGAVAARSPRAAGPRRCSTG